MNQLTRIYPFVRLITEPGEDSSSFDTQVSLTPAQVAESVSNKTGMISFIGKEEMPNLLELAVIGTRSSADNETGQFRIIFRRLDEASGLYVPTTQITIEATLGTLQVGTTDEGTAIYAADTFTVVGTPAVSSDQYRVLSPADNTMARLQIDVMGNPVIEVDAKTGTCNYINVLTAHIG